MTTWPALDDTFLAHAAATFNFKLGHPVPLAVAPDGTVLFRRTQARDFVNELYVLAPDGTETPLERRAPAGPEQLTDAERARRERARIATRGIVAAELSDDGHHVLFQQGGAVVRLDRRSRARDEVILDGVDDPHLAPDGEAFAFVRDGDLWVYAFADRTERRLTHHPEGFEDGVADFAAQEELGRRRGYWWSPDSTQLAFARVDNRAVDTIYVADARHNDRKPVPFKYPRVGTANAQVALGVVAIAGGSNDDVRWLAWDPVAIEYLVDVDWDAHGGLTARVLDRLQTRLQYLAFDLATGASRALVDERDDTWIAIDAGRPRWLADGSGFLWMTEAHGDAWSLELRDPRGAVVRTVVGPDFGLRRLINTSDDGAIVQASTDPTRADIWYVPIAGGDPVRLSVYDGVSDAMTANDVTVITTSHSTGGTTTFSVALIGERLLRSVAERPPSSTTALETVELDGRTHHVAITRPRAFDPARRYPVLLHVYGGPHKQMVLAAADSYAMDQWYADAGFIVVRSDGRGTPARGHAWERAIARDLLTVPLADQVAALRAVGARHRELDLARVGVFGWSFGGYLATLATMLHPEVFACGVAGAPVTDWALYDTAYTERYMKLPADNADGYRATSALTHANQLARPLLVIHGITDDNVHFAHALALIEALYLAHKRAEVITLSATHMVPDPTLYAAREHQQVDFFRAHLA